MTSKLNFRKSILAGFCGGLTAAAINIVLYALFHGSGVISDDIHIKPGVSLNLVPVIIMSIVPLIIGGIVFFLFEKYSNQGYKYFSVLSITLLILSFTQPFIAIPNVTMGYALVLNLMHVVAVAALLYFIRRGRQQLINK